MMTPRPQGSAADQAQDGEDFPIRRCAVALGGAFGSLRYEWQAGGLMAGKIMQSAGSAALAALLTGVPATVLAQQWPVGRLPSAAEDYVLAPSPAMNFYGVPGLLDMPSAEQLPDGYLGATVSRFGAITRTTLTFQIAPRLSGSFRYTAVRDWNAAFCPPSCEGTDQFDVYYDRSFDLRYQIVKETDRMPAITVGLQDFVGTGLLSGEYLVATKTLPRGVKLTAGLGWGRLGSYGAIGETLGTRPPIEIGEGGNINSAPWFKGDVAPFFGVEWALNPNWNLKAEYSSDAYTLEAEERDIFDRRSPLNFGVEYTMNSSVRLGAYSLYGSEFGVAAHFLLDPARRPVRQINTINSVPVRPRPSRASSPAEYDPSWVKRADGNAILRSTMSEVLARDGVILEALGYTSEVAQVRIRNDRYNSEGQAIGRTARVMAAALPESVERFEIVPVVAGMPVSKVTIRRADLEAIAPSSDAEAMLERVTIGQAAAPIAGLAFDPVLYPKFTWGISPYLRLRLFDQNDPIKGDIGLRLAARYEVVSGLFLSTTATKKLVGNLDDPPPEITTGLPPVRSDVDIYDAEGDPALETAQAVWYSRIAPDVYGRVSVGLLERMFGGVSTEVLWMPVDGPLAVGAEVNYVAQRDPDQMLGFSVYDYQVATGHLSFYYDLGRGYQAQVDVGRYLAGDYGATLALDREFATGWRIGAFATKTNVSAEDFGSGSFDKGIRITIPMDWAFGRTTRAERTTVIRPFGRDGGQRLEVDGRLYDLVRDYTRSGIDAQWSSFWN
jgi:hypothetical protein